MTKQEMLEAFNDILQAYDNGDGAQDVANKSLRYARQFTECKDDSALFQEDDSDYIVETQLPFPVVLVVHDHAAYMEMTDVLGVEPFPYYNAQGGPHWAVFTEVDYRMEYIIDVDVPALRKLLTALFERRVFGVIVVGNA